MPPSRPAPVVDPGGVIRLRPRSATILSLLVWGVCLLLSVQAVVGAGWEGVLALPLPLLISAAVWALLWSPQVILREDGVRVRNILHSYWLPFDAISAVRIGAMLRLDAVDAQGRERTVTAWNAPGLPRASAPSAGARRRAEQGGTPIASESQRLAADQAACPSSVVRQRWQRLAADDAPVSGSPGTDGPAMSVRIRVEVIVLLAAGVALLVASILA